MLSQPLAVVRRGRGWWRGGDATLLHARLRIFRTIFGTCSDAVQPTRNMAEYEQVEVHGCHGRADRIGTALESRLVL
jgi:hypothetical protein